MTNTAYTNQSFGPVRNRADLAKALGVSEHRLIWHAYRAERERQYRTFLIPKKSGGRRVIEAPTKSLKELQQRISKLLQGEYKPRKCVKGFLPDESIVGNALPHIRRRWVLNIDLEDFFPSINFGRVRGMLMARPYGFPERVATILAQICCHQGHLPQGAPTSPVVSNMICAKLDSELLRYSRIHRVMYSRYADDITFSSNDPVFPQAIAKSEIPGLGGAVELSVNLVQIVTGNGFQINNEKVRLQSHKRRQMVTGLIVNRKPNVRRKYIRQIRAMLNAWEKWGYEAAQSEYLARYDRKRETRLPVKPAPEFRDVISGKLAFLKMVRGTDDEIVRKYYNWYESLL